MEATVDEKDVLVEVKVAGKWTVHHGQLEDGSE